MNMKKTIAAIAAGAMAVSAMASSVSAIELKDQVLSYNLVKTVTNETDGSVVLTAMFTNVQVASGKDLIVGVKLPDNESYGVTSLTVSGKYLVDDTQQIYTYTRNAGKSSENYDPTIENGYMVVKVNTAPAHLDSGKAASGMNITVTATVKHRKGKIDIINNAIVASGKDIAIWYANDQTAGDTWKAKVYPVISVEDWKKLPKDSDNNVADQKDDYELIDENGTVTPDVNKAKYARLNSSAAASIYRKSTMDVVLGNTAASAFTAAGTSEEKIPFATYSGSQIKNKNIAEYLQTELGYTNVLPVINDAIANYGTVTFTFHTAAQPIAWKAEGDGEAFGPEKSSWGNEKLDRSWDTRLDGIDVDGYNTALYVAYNDPSKVYAVYAEDWYGDKSYMSFTQHLYNGTTDIYGAGAGWAGFTDEGTGFYGGLWGDNNLFGGALVINENLTMRLSDVDMFD